MPSVEFLCNGDSDWIFQQDNVPCHKSRLVNSYFNENNIRVMPWPPRSPDLNPIEHVWNLIDKKIKKIKKLKFLIDKKTY